MSQAENFQVAFFDASNTPTHALHFDIEMNDEENWNDTRLLLCACLNHVVDIAILGFCARCFILQNIATDKRTADNTLSGTMYFVLLDPLGNAHMEIFGFNSGLGFVGSPIVKQIHPLTQFEAFEGFEELIDETKENTSTPLPKKRDKEN